MYLIRTNVHTLVDMSTGNVIENIYGGLFVTPPNPPDNMDYYTHPVIPADVAQRVWEHLESLVRFDATKLEQPSTKEPSALDALCYCAEPDGLDDRTWAIGMGGR